MFNASAADARLPLVLIVDDSTAARAIMGAVLSGLGVHIEEAGDGAAAFGLLLAKRYDLLITDLNMTPVDGRQLVLATRLLGLDRRPKIIVCSSDHDTTDSATRVALQSADRIIAKPYTAPVLISAVLALLTKTSGTAMA